MVDVMPASEIDAHLFEVFYRLYGLSRADLVLGKDRTFSESEILLFFKLVKELKSGKPLAYALGVKEFYGLDFYVNNNVLIPRPETEELVNWILQNKEATRKKFKILDIGTGSGCIAVSLKKHLSKAQVTALDVSQDALQVAERNARKLGVNLSFLCQDVLNEELEETYDLIVSNPPYISVEEKDKMESNVLDHEPGIALFAEGDSLIFYKRMIELARKNLAKDGWVYWEINQYLFKGLMDILKTKGFRSVELQKDINDNPRMIRFQNRA